MTLKLELETERRSCAVLRTGLEQQQVRSVVVVAHMLSLFECNLRKIFNARELRVRSPSS